jgi:hypothetical protein
MTVDVGANEWTQWHDREMQFAGIIKSRPRKGAADAPTFQLFGHLRMQEDDAIAAPLVLDVGQRSVDAGLVPLGCLVVDDLDTTARPGSFPRPGAAGPCPCPALS